MLLVCPRRIILRALATAGNKSSFALHGYLGAAVIVAAEALLFGGNQFVGHWFTPIVWTGYILLVDALVYRLRGRSLLVNDRLELLVVATVSIASWWLFEFYNAPRFWNSDLELWWHYHNLEPNLFLRRIGYDWAFATISTALFETADLFQLVFRRGKQSREIHLPKSILVIVTILGAVVAILPLVYPSTWFAPLVWLSFIFFLDPLNYLRGSPSIIGDVAVGYWGRALSLLLSGFVCGVLWEFWNYWALSKWTYTVPYFGNIKIFEMPVLGYLGFPPFAVECWVMYIFCRSWLSNSRFEDADSIWIRNYP